VIIVRCRSRESSGFWFSSLLVKQMPDEVDDSSIMNVARQNIQQYLVVDGVKVLCNIAFNEPGRSVPRS
jgi:hypothetical protein